MPNELFRAIAGRRSSAAHRLGGVPLSVALHAAALVVAVVIPLLATDVLPVPQIPLVLDITSIPAVAVPHVPAPRVTRPALVSPDSLGAPVVAPSGIAPETGVEPTPPVISDVPMSELIGTTNVGQLITDSEIVPPSPLKPVDPIRVGGKVLPPRKIRNQAPVYPPLALAAHVEGTVVIDAIISTTGAVQEARVVTSVPLLDEAALAAVRQWVFTPTLLNGVPVPVIMTVRVEFKLR